jgi:tRNA pseudouridine38-40 synthase
MSKILRYFLKIGYRGTKYHGWQIQGEERTVQKAIEDAISLLLRQKTEVIGCGRTDTGVHASTYFLHFDCEEELDAIKFVYKLNGILDFDIAVYELIPVKNTAHARFDAISRTYRYFIHQQKNPFLNDTSKFIAGEIDFALMNKAAEMLPKFTDFQSFAKVSPDVNNYKCTVFNAGWTQLENQWMFEISANRFLRNMVRAIVGTLLEVGTGKLSLNDFDQVVLQKDRSAAGKSVDAKGLFLFKVEYPYIS